MILLLPWSFMSDSGDLICGTDGIPVLNFDFFYVRCLLGGFVRGNDEIIFAKYTHTILMGLEL